MSCRLRDRVVLGTAALLAIAVVAGGWVARDVLAVAVGHKAKTLCSGVFVSGREPGDVLAELQVEDLALLRHVRWSVDASRKWASAWRQPGDDRAAITLDHLLRMSSGLRFDEGMASPRSDIMRMLFQTGDASSFAAAKPLEAPPGARCSTGSACRAP
jgi:hypothetical protein